MYVEVTNLLGFFGKLILASHKNSPLLIIFVFILWNALKKKSHNVFRLERVIFSVIIKY